MKLQALLKHYMMVAIVFWVLLMVVVAFLHFGSIFVLGFVNKKYEKAFNSYKSLSREIMVNQSLKYRSKVLGTVLKNRFEYSSAFEKINTVFGEKAKVAEFELGNRGEFSLVVSADDKEGVDFVEERVLEINNGQVEGVKKAIIKDVAYALGEAWKIEMEVILK